MFLKVSLILCCFIYFSDEVFAQTCSVAGAPGQTPISAFPVCGTAAFHQSSVPVCANGVIPEVGCQGDAISYIDAKSLLL